MVSVDARIDTDDVEEGENGWTGNVLAGKKLSGILP